MKKKIKNFEENLIQAPKKEFLKIKNLLIIYISIAIIFAVLYLYLPNGLVYQSTGEPIKDFWDSLYFSFATILTIGYGDLIPLGIIRGLTAIEGLIGWILFGVIVYKIVSSRQDLILKEIHRSSNEQHLSKIRNYLFISNTNLERFIKNLQTKKISKDAESYELHIISTNLMANIEEARRFLQNVNTSPEEKIEKEEILLLVKGINLSLMSFTNSLELLGKKNFEKDTVLKENTLKIFETIERIYFLCYKEIGNLEIEKLKKLSFELEKYLR